MKNILVPTDFSDNAFNALQYAIDLHANETCNFYLLHVNNTIQTSTDKEFIEENYLKPSKVQLEKIVSTVTQNNANKKDNHFFFMLNDYDFLIDSIRHHVNDKKIDLIVIGTKGASGLKEILIGSNTGEIIKKIQCPTLVIPEKAKFTKIKEIAFPTDFSLFYDIKTLLPLSKIVYDKQAGLRILHISKNELHLDNDQKNNRDLLEDFFAESDLSFHYLTNAKVEQAVQCFVESRHIDLITMVAKNLNYFQQILFHTKVEKISYHINVPFLVLHQ